MYLYSSPEPLNGAHGQGKSEVKVGEDVIVVWYARVSFSNQSTPHNHFVPSLSILERIGASLSAKLVCKIDVSHARAIMAHGYSQNKTALWNHLSEYESSRSNGS